MTQPPSTHNLRYKAQQLAQQFPPIMLAAERVAATVSQGLHGRRKVGQGETFWQFRPYQTGDARHQIDWRQSAKSAKSGALYLKQNEWDACESVWIWSDRSRSMNYCSSRQYPEKSDRALLLALALAALLMKNGEQVAWFGENDKPASGRMAFNRMCFKQFETLSSDLNLPQMLPLPRFAKVILFSDFLSPVQDYQNRLSALSAYGVQGHLIKIADPAETDWTFKGHIHFIDPETGIEKRIGQAKNLTNQYQQAFLEHSEKLMDMARSYGWSYHAHSTNTSPEQALLSLYQSLAIKPKDRNRC